MSTRESWSQRLKGSAHQVPCQPNLPKLLSTNCALQQITVQSEALGTQLGRTYQTDAVCCTVTDFRGLDTDLNPGGRTAWSCVVNVQGQQFPARFWYDGAYMDQAREDASEMALRNMTGYANTSVEPPPASHYTRTQG